MPEINNNTDKVTTPVSFDQKHHSHIGPILGVLIIMLVLILGGLYLWGSMLSQEASVMEEKTLINNEPETPRADADTQILETLSPSDEISAIEADLSATNLDSLDSDLVTIDAELGAALLQ